MRGSKTAPSNFPCNPFFQANVGLGTPQISMDCGTDKNGKNRSDHLLENVARNVSDINIHRILNNFNFLNSNN